MSMDSGHELRAFLAPHGKIGGGWVDTLLTSGVLVPPIQFFEMSHVRRSMKCYQNILCFDQLLQKSTAVNLLLFKLSVLVEIYNANIAVPCVQYLVALLQVFT